jgi:hypothetical protein
MQTWNDLQTPDPNLMILSNALDLLCEIHGRKMSHEAKQHWMRRLLPLAGSAVFAAMAEACDARAHFELAWIIETAAAKNRRDTKPYVAPTEPTELERHQSDAAALKSLLWLHYVHKWDLATCGAETIGRVFARQRGIDPADVPAVLDAARAAYPRETIVRWMDDQATR